MRTYIAAMIGPDNGLSFGAKLSPEPMMAYRQLVDP